MLNQEPWPLQPDKCPCDVDFVAWLASTHDGHPRRVFHMGPGEHHLVGRHLSAAGEYCTALTASPGELVSWAALPAFERQNYECYIADVYDFDPLTVPTFDVVSLFHLGEMTEPDDPRIWHTLRRFVSGLDFGGLLALYPGSSGFDRIIGMVSQLEAVYTRGIPNISPSEDFGSIRIWRKC